MGIGIQINNNKIDFKYLFKIAKIDIDRVTFKKFEVENPTMNIIDNTKSNISIGKEIGEEIHICKPDVIYEVAGKVGSVIKGFEVVLLGKSRKKVLVSKILYIE